MLFFGGALYWNTIKYKEYVQYKEVVQTSKIRTVPGGAPVIPVQSYSWTAERYRVGLSTGCRGETWPPRLDTAVDKDTMRRKGPQKHKECA